MARRTRPGVCRKLARSKGYDFTVCSRPGGKRNFEITARKDGERAGRLLYESDRTGRDHYVSWVKVESGHQRQKVASALYETAAGYLCDQGSQLRSDRDRTAASDGFWVKQTNKGRAICRRKLRKGEIPAFTDSKCQQYEMSPDICNVPELDLSGTRRRRRR